MRLTGVAEAWADSVPVLLIAGQVNAGDLDRECGNYHEIDLEAIFRPVTKWCGTVRRAEQITRDDCAGFSGDDRWPAAARGDLSAPGPDARSRAPRLPVLPALELPAQPAVPRTAVVAGGGTAAGRLAGRSFWPGEALSGQGPDDEIRELACQLECPVITTLNAKGILDERDPWSLGHARSVRARTALPHADVMLAVGCRFTEVLTDWRRMPVPRQLVQIDLDTSSDRHELSGRGRYRGRCPSRPGPAPAAAAGSPGRSRLGIALGRGPAGSRAAGPNG